MSTSPVNTNLVLATDDNNYLFYVVMDLDKNADKAYRGLVFLSHDDALHQIFA